MAGFKVITEEVITEDMPRRSQMGSRVGRKPRTKKYGLFQRTARFGLTMWEWFHRITWSLDYFRWIPLENMGAEKRPCHGNNYCVG